MPISRGWLRLSWRQRSRQTRVSAFKAEKAADVAGVSGDLRKQLEDVADRQLKAKGRITRPHRAVGRQVGIDGGGNRTW